MFFAFSCNNFQLLETKKAAPEKWKTAKKIDLISYLNDIGYFILSEKNCILHKMVNFLLIRFDSSYFIKLYKQFIETIAFIV